jgi:spore coat polysaccharide biosynthesis protein SpsF
MPMKPTITAIIQARMNSTRLPGKAMMELAGRTLLYHVFDRVTAIKSVDRVVLATCDGGENGEIIHLAQSMGIDVFVGSEENVLERFYLASERFGGDYIMRVTGDNPFTDPGYAEQAVRASIEAGADICYFPNLPLGTGVGMVKKSALNTAYQKSDQPHQLEHVTPYIKEHPESFNIRIRDVEIRNPFPNLRLTVDTPEDFELARILYDNLYRGAHFPLSDVIAYLEHNPQLVAINSRVQQRPMTHSSIQCGPA